MPFPQVPDKHAGRPYVTPHRLLEYRASQGRAAASPPPAVIVSWQRVLLERVKARRAPKEVPGPSGTLLVLPGGVGFVRLPIGAPVVAVVLEELAALGVEVVVGVGAAGGLAADLAPGDIVLCSAALRDEGTSHHYVPPGRWARPDAALLAELGSSLAGATVGSTWTTDAPYRETAQEIVAYRDEGVLTVDMEAAALFTVASCLGVRAASVFCVSDVLHGPAWEPHFGARLIDEALWRAFEAAESTLVRRVRGHDSTSGAGAGAHPRGGRLASADASPCSMGGQAADVTGGNEP